MWGGKEKGDGFKQPLVACDVDVSVVLVFQTCPVQGAKAASDVVDMCDCS